MIRLGNYFRHGLTHVVRNASRALRDECEIALFVGQNGEAAAYAHHHPSYERHTRVHHKSLVGVYRLSDACDRVARAQYNQIEEDVEHHVRAQTTQRSVA